MPHWLAFWMKHCTESQPGELWKYLCAKRVLVSGDCPLARLIAMPTEKREAADVTSRVSDDRRPNQKRGS